jgi:hypothetical protein
MKSQIVRLLPLSLLSLALGGSLHAEPVSPAVNACKKDADCALLPMLCPACAPCEGAWQEAGTLEQRRRRVRSAEEVRCAAPECKGECGRSGQWIGSRAICRAQRCVPAFQEAAPSPKQVACAKDSDCVPRPRSNCGCSPCGLQVVPAVSRAHAEWLQKEYARESCPAVRCAKCGRPVRHFKMKPVCHARSCAMVPLR